MEPQTHIIYRSRMEMDAQEGIYTILEFLIVDHGIATAIVLSLLLLFWFGCVQYKKWSHKNRYKNPWDR